VPVTWLDSKKEFVMKKLASLLIIVAMTLSAALAVADEGSSSKDSSSKSGYNWGLDFTIGEGMVFYQGDVYRRPVNLELVPSFGWKWFKFDLGLVVGLESLEVAGTDIGHWAFTFRPGGRLTPPMIPLYLRVAFPLVCQRDNFDFGVMFGLGVDIKVFKILGIIIEVDTSLNDDYSWGGDGVPLEFRVGISLKF
jgi:hypothetical protein